MPVRKIDIWKVDKHMSFQGEPLKGLQWLDPKKFPAFVFGLPRFEKERLYRRLPLKPAWPIRPEVDVLANCPAGGQLRFQTASSRLAIRVLLSDYAGMHHMPATGQCGFDCYLGASGKQHYFKTTIFDHKKISYEYLFYGLKEKEKKNITINFPLYQGVKEILIGLDKGAKLLSPLPYKNNKKIIFYGTSITQGGCASRPGMAYTNILSRRFNQEFINLGFSGNGRGEPELAKLILEIENPACFVLDYEANSLSTEMLKKTLPEFINILRSKHAKTPILVLSQTPFSYLKIDKKQQATTSERREFERKTVGSLRKRGDKNIYALDGSKLMGADFEECTVDGAHPTDLGFMRIADNLTPVLRKLIK